MKILFVPGHLACGPRLEAANKNAMSIGDAVYLIGEAYRDNGYDTYFWADHPMASPELNFAQGIRPENTFWTKRAK